jgi:hypothetical protein
MGDFRNFLNDLENRRSDYTGDYASDPAHIFYRDPDHAENGTIPKINRSVHTPSPQQFASTIIHKTNPTFEQLAKELEEIKMMLARVEKKLG